MSRPPRLHRVMDGPVCSPRLGSVHTLTTHTTEHTHFPKDTQKQLSLVFSSFVITAIPPPANLALVLSSGFTAVRKGLRKCLLQLHNYLLRTHHSCTIYFIYYFLSTTTIRTQTHAKKCRYKSTLQNLPCYTLLPLCPSSDSSKLKIVQFCWRECLHNKT